MNKIDLGTCYRIVFEALAKGQGAQSITDALFAYTQMPIHVVDISFNVIAASYGATTGSRHLDDILPRKVVPPEVVIGEYYRLGYIEMLEKHEKSIVVDWGVIEVPQASAAIRINGNIEGLCATTFSNQEQALLALEINDILCKAIAIELERQHRSLERPVDPIHQVIARELFRDLFPEQDQKEHTEFIEIGLLKPNYQIAVITPIVPNNAWVQYVRNAVLDVFPDAYCLNKGEYLYLLHANIQKNESQTLSHTFNRLMEKYQCHCGLSGLFDNISKRVHFRIRAQKALELGHTIHPEKNLYYFDEYYLEILSSYAAAEMGEAAYTLPELERLREVDGKKGTDYYHTLKTHFVLGNNINLTAAKLHIHRNTLIYRLTKIEEITEVDLNDQNVIRRLLAAMTMRYVAETLQRQDPHSSPLYQDFWARS